MLVETVMITNKVRNIFSYCSSTTITLVLILFINFLFMVKYSSRYIDTPYLLASVYILILMFAFYIPKMMSSKFPFKKAMFILLILYIFFVSVLLVSIPKESLRVDRWWMIQTFLDNLFSGTFPYTPRSNSNIPSPFPFYYLLLIPFYAIEEIALATLIMLVVFSLILSKKSKYQIYALRVLVLLLGSSAFAWEILTRSTIFFNMIVVILYFLFFEKVKHKQSNSFIVFGILGGLILSTRSVVALPMMIFFIFHFLKNKKIKELSLQFIIISSTFLITFLPLYLWDSKLFSLYNPILIQSGFISGWVLFFILVLALLLGSIIRSELKVYFVSGLILFFAVFLPFIISVYNNDFHSVIFNNVFDISYFIFSMPFFLVYLVFNFNVKIE